MAVTGIELVKLRPLSCAQSSIWFAQMLDSHSPIFPLSLLGCGSSVAVITLLRRAPPAVLSWVSRLHSGSLSCGGRAPPLTCSTGRLLQQ